MSSPSAASTARRWTRSPGGSASRSPTSSSCSAPRRRSSSLPCSAPLSAPSGRSGRRRPRRAKTPAPPRSSRAWATAYQRLLDDRSLLLMQMQAYAACEDDAIREVVRDEMLRLVSFVQSASGAPDDGRARVARLRHADERRRRHGPHRRGRRLGAHDVPGQRHGAGVDGRRRGRQGGAHEVDAGRAFGSRAGPGPLFGPQN